MIHKFLQLLEKDQKNGLAVENAFPFNTFGFNDGLFGIEFPQSSWCHFEFQKFIKVTLRICKLVRATVQRFAIWTCASQGSTILSAVGRKISSNAFFAAMSKFVRLYLAQIASDMKWQLTVQEQKKTGGELIQVRL